MSLDVATAAKEAVDRVTTPAAAVLAVLFTITGVVQSLAAADLLLWSVESLYEYLQEIDPEAAAEVEPDVEQTLAQQPAGLGLDAAPAFALWLVGFVAGLAVLAVAIDAFAREVDDPSEFGPAHFGWTTVNLVFGGIVYGVLTIGGLLLILPGIVFGVVLLYFPVAVVVDEDWFGAAFLSSVEAVGDDLLATLGIVLLILVAYVTGLLASSILIAALPGLAATVLQQVVGAVIWVFVVALLTRAYVDATDATPGASDEIVDDDWDTLV